MSFRTTYKAGPGLMLGIAVLLGVGVVAAMEAGTRGGPGRRSGPGSSWLRPVGLGIVLPVFVAVGVLLASYPFWTERLYTEDDGFKTIPRYWDQTFSYLEERQQPSRVLVLPGAEESRYRWGSVHDSLFDALSPAAPVISRSLRQGTAESADLVLAIDEYVSSSGYERGSLAPILARLGVRWVVLQNDLDWQRMGVPRPDTYDERARRSEPSPRRDLRPPGHQYRQPGRSQRRCARRVGAAASGDLRGARGALAAAPAARRPAFAGRGRWRLVACAGVCRAAGRAARRLHRSRGR